MGDAEDLAPFGELAQVRADGACRVTADSGVDLVEHEQRAVAVTADRHTASRLAAAPPLVGAAALLASTPCATLSSASITRESSPPEATSRSGPDGQPGVGRDQELDRVTAARAVATVTLPHGDLEPRIGHRELVQALEHRRRQPRRRLLSRSP